MQESDKRILAYICHACKLLFYSRFASRFASGANFLQGIPCFTAVDQLRELVITLQANLSTAMLRMASVSRAYAVFCVEIQAGSQNQPRFQLRNLHHRYNQLNFDHYEQLCRVYSWFAQ